MQLCSFKMRGMKRDEKKFYYIIYNIITIYLVRKNYKDNKPGKK